MRLVATYFLLLALSSAPFLTPTTATTTSRHFITDDADADSVVDGFFTTTGHHTNNWAVLVCTSRFWFNYRHMANTLSMYRTVKRLGVPDSQIILMLADDTSCNPRNAAPGSVFNSRRRALDLYGDNVEVDYRGYEVNVENFIRVLTGRVTPDTPRSKRLLTDDRSNILVYMTGHGGDEFLKFQDAEEISAYDLADAFGQMWEKKRYHEILFMIDTCQANTMYSQFYSPNILATGSSRKGENSLSHHADSDLGVAVIDRFTYVNLEFLEKVDMRSNATLADLFDRYNPDQVQSHPGVRTDLFRRSADKVLVTDFFGSVQNVEVSVDRYDLSGGEPASSSRVIRKSNVPEAAAGSATSSGEHSVIGGERDTAGDDNVLLSWLSPAITHLKRIASFAHIFPFASHHGSQHSLYRLHKPRRGEDMLVF